MSAETLLTSLFQYKALANDELFVCLKALNEKSYASDLDTAIQILNHAHIADCIFAANLQRKPHGYTAAGTKEVPPFEELCSAVKKIDRLRMALPDAWAASFLS